MLSQRVRNIAHSATLSIDAKAKQLKKEGKDVVIFGAGEPDFNTPESIKQAAKKAKLLILNSPSNPSGAIVDPSEIRKIPELAVKHNFYVISDEVYEHFVYENKEFLSIASLNDEIKKLTITCNSVSKTYAMTGWRIGYCGA